MTDLSTHVFALDLTSVCVSTGIVQLPMKMQPFFEDGEIDATVDGEGVRLEFAGPRRLGGFREHFEKRGLNANDKIRFELKCNDAKAVEVLAACVKRERSKPSTQTQHDVDDNERVVTEAATTDSEGPAATREGDGGSWTSAGGTVRAVRRVTIVGSDMLPVVGSGQQNQVGSGYVTKGRAPAGQVKAKSSSWQALDGLTRDDASEHAVDIEFADTTVRAVRRRPNYDESARNGSGTAVPDSELANRPAQEDGSQQDGVVQSDYAVDHSSPVRLSDLVAPSEKPRGVDRRSRPAPGRTRIFAGRGPRAEQSTLAGEAHPVSAQNEPTVTRSAASGPLAERELVPVARSMTAASRAAPAPLATADDAAVEGSFMRSASTLFSNVATVEAAEEKPSAIGEAHGNANLFQRVAPAAKTSVRSAAAVPTASSRASALVIDDADFGGEYAAPRRKDESAVEVEHELDIGPDDLQPAQSPAGATGNGSSPTDLEQDLILVTEYLDRPEVPAIVRSDIVAERLGLTAERCERALERLSEGRDRVSRIRKGAYMIRRDATKRGIG